MKPSRKPAEAFTLIELLIVVVSLGILAAILLPALARSRIHPSRINCANNLKQVAISFRTWALDNNEKFPMQVSVTNGGTMELVNSGLVFPHFLVMSNELSTPKILICPEDENPARTEATTFGSLPGDATPQIPFTNDNNVSYFVGVDADQSQPAMPLSGDSNLAINGVPTTPGLHQIWSDGAVAWVKPWHDNGGNICFADGSVQRVSPPDLGLFFSQTGVATNRLALP